MLELKPYQKKVLSDLRRYLTYLAQPMSAYAAFQKYWAEHPAGKIVPEYNTFLEPYKSQKLGNVPNICVKVPTGGGKTFIGCHALATIFDFYAENRPRTAVWLVPSRTIYEQTLQALQNPTHPYRQTLNKLFQHRIQIIDKNDLLNGVHFNERSVQNQVTVVVLTFQSLRASNKEERKLYQQNTNYVNFATSMDYNESPHEQTDITSAMHSLRTLNPVVIVDESHNAESELSVEMLSQLNPNFVLDLTATPRKSANIISFTNSYELKRENMVKLPIIVYNQPDKRVVIQSAIDLQARLEQFAQASEAQGNAYIRPIVLFQAQSKNNAAENTTFEQVKKELIQNYGLPAAHIAIKTATINELQNQDLFSRDCPIRYIITINALKEGWDCSFAYILASLADRHSETDVTQIVGRVLRQPYARPCVHPLLNNSYIFTASAHFNATLQRIIEGLKMAGFSERDYKTEDAPKPVELPTQLLPTGEQGMIDFDKPLPVFEPMVRENTPSYSKSTPSFAIEQIEQNAFQQQHIYQEQVRMSAEQLNSIAPEMEQNMKQTQIQQRYLLTIKDLYIPQFYIVSNQNALFGNGVSELLTDVTLMERFELSTADSKIDFSALDEQIAQIDLDEFNTEHKPIWEYAKSVQKDHLIRLIHNAEKQEQVINTFISRLLKMIGNLYPIGEKEIQAYLKRILEKFTPAQFEAILDKPTVYSAKIKLKIAALSRTYREQVFEEWLQIGKIRLEKGYSFSLKRPLYKVTTADGIRNALYMKEESMNSWELDVIGSVANLENIEFWTRNEAKKTFFMLNGATNHYPDFIAYTKSGKIILIESKGDHLDGSDSQQKIALGAHWEKAMHGKGFYFMIFKEKKVAGGFLKSDFLRRLSQL